MKDPFHFWNENYILEYFKDDVRIYSDIRLDFSQPRLQFLFVGQTMYASTTERSWYIQNLYPYAQGRCLEIGLGLGVASKVILASGHVDHLLTIEKNEQVIEAFGRPLSKHNILHADINEWAKQVAFGPMYDFIFVDHYADMDDEVYEEVRQLVAKLETLLKPGGNLVVWVDEAAALEDIKRFTDLWIGAAPAASK